MIMTKVVKIKAERGYGSGMFKVMSTKGVGYMREVNLEPIGGGQRFNLFEAHTFEDMECKRTSIALRDEKIEEAKKIGTRKKR